MADFRISDDQLNVIITKAIMDTLTPENREALITNAVKQLLNRDTGNAYDKRSAFQHAFDDAIARVAREVAEAEIQKDGKIGEAIKQLIIDAWVKLTTGTEYGQTVEKVAEAMARALSKTSY